MGRALHFWEKVLFADLLLRGNTFGLALGSSGGASHPRLDAEADM
jgi:hypothetical protein